MIPAAVSTMPRAAPTRLCPPIFTPPRAAELPFVELVLVLLFPPVSLGTDPLGTAPEEPEGLAPDAEEPEVDDDDDDDDEEPAVGRLVIVDHVPPLVVVLGLYAKNAT